VGSLIGNLAKQLAIRNQTPVPIGDSTGVWPLPSMALGGSSDEALMRAFGTNGTVNANVSMLASSTAGPVWKLFRQAPEDGRRRYTTADQGSDQRTEVIRHQALNVLNKPATMILNGRETVFWTRFALFEL